MPRKNKRGPPPIVPSLKIYLDITVQNKKTLKHSKIKLSDVMYHTIDANLNVDSTYDEILSSISNYLSTNNNNLGTKYDIVPLPSAILFGRSQARKNNKRETNNIIGVTSEFMKDYIDSYAVIVKEKKVYKAAGSVKKKKASMEPRVVAIDLACVVQQIEPEEDISTVGDTSIPRNVRAKQTYQKIIPQLHATYVFSCTHKSTSSHEG